MYAGSFLALLKRVSLPCDAWVASKPALSFGAHLVVFQYVSVSQTSPFVRSQSCFLSICEYPSGLLFLLVLSVISFETWVLSKLPLRFEVRTISPASLHHFHAEGAQPFCDGSNS